MHYIKENTYDFNGKFFKVETNVSSPNILRMCSHLDLIVKYEVIDEDARETSEEASESRRDEHHQTRT